MPRYYYWQFTIQEQGSKRTTNAQDHAFNTWKIQDLNIFLRLNPICITKTFINYWKHEITWSDIQLRWIYGEKYGNGSYIRDRKTGQEANESLGERWHRSGQRWWECRWKRRGRVENIYEIKLSRHWEWLKAEVSEGRESLPPDFCFRGIMDGGAVNRHYTFAYNHLSVGMSPPLECGQRLLIISVFQHLA